MLAALASAAGFLGNDPLRLNRDLAHNVRGGHFLSSALSPDGSRVVYVADLLTDGVFELFVSPADGSGGALRLSGPLVPGGDIESFVIAPGGGHVFYRADQEVDGLIEFYSAPIDGSAAPVNLNGSLTNGLFFRDVSPDGAWGVFLADNANGKTELYSAAMDGSQPAVKISHTLGPGGFVRYDLVSISPDSERVVYQAFQNNSLVRELYSVPIGGGTAVKLNGALATGGDVEFAFLSPDSGWVAYTADQLTDNVVELFGVPLAGGTAVRLSGALASNISQVSLSATPGIPFVLYRAVQDTPGISELFSVPADGSAPAVELNAPLPAGLSVVTYSIASGVARAVYLTGGTSATVFSVPLDASAPAVQLSTTPPAGTVVSEYAIAPGGAHVVYWTRPSGFGPTSHIFAVPMDGSASAVLLSAGAPGARVSFSPSISPDGSSIVYLRENGVYYDLYGAPIDGSQAPQKLNGSLSYAYSELSPSRFAFASSSTAVFLSSSAGITELHHVPIDGSSAPVRVNGPLAPQGEVTGFQLSADRSRVLYSASEPLLGITQLHCAAPDGDPAAVRVNDPLPPGPLQGDVQQFVLTSDASRAVYAAPQDVYGLVQLYAANTDGTLQPERLDDGLGHVSSLVLMPDGLSVLYLFHPVQNGPGGLTERLRLAWLDGSQTVELPGEFAAVASLRVTPDGGRALFRQPDFYDDALLMSVRLDGFGPTLVLDERDVLFDYLLTPDGTRVVYRRGPLFALGGPTELRSALVDGSAGPLVLSETPAEDDTVTSFGLTPEGTRACFLSDQAVDNRNELFSTLVDGSGLVLRLSGTLVAGGSVSSMTVAAAGPHVAYVADQTVNDRFELFSVPNDGSAPAVKLNPALVTGGDVLSCAISPDGTRVVYVADQTTNDVFELHSVPSDGSQPAVRLSGAMVTGGDVSTFQFTPDGSRVLYRADQDQNDVIALYSVPIGGGAAVRLSPPPVSGGGVATVVSSADSQWVVYLADQNVDGVNELFRTLVDGSGSVERVSGLLVPGGSVGGTTPSFRVGPDARTVVFTADKVRDGVIELFSATPDRIRKHRAR